MSLQNPKRSLKEIFVSTFHDKMSFEAFLNLDAANEYKIVNLKRRTVYAPSPLLKQAHRFLNRTIFEHAQFNQDVVYSYRKGFSARNAVEKHAKRSVFFQTDIHDFYANIRLVNVNHALESQLEFVPVSDARCYMEEIIKLVVVDNQIPAGFATSPLLSNICLFDFDNALLKFCESNNLTYTRYSDDLIISGDETEFTHSIVKIIENLLADTVNADIKLNQDKTRVHKKGHQFRLLGLVILPNGIVTIPRAEKNYVEAMLYFFLTDHVKFESFCEKTLSVEKVRLEDRSIRELGIASLSGKLIAFNAMDRNYISKLRTKYGNSLIDMFLRKSVK